MPVFTVTVARSVVLFCCLETVDGAEDETEAVAIRYDTGVGFAEHFGQVAAKQRN